jgi:type II secretory pathway component GspD/PulD (secretin)
VDVNLKEADMMTATRMLMQQAGVQFVVEPSSDPYGRITLKLDGATAEDAVRYICQAAGAYFRRDENGVYIISHHPQVVVDHEAKHAKRPVLKRIKVLNNDVRDIYDQVEGRIPYDYVRGFELLKKFGQAQAPTNTFGMSPGASVQSTPTSTYVSSYAPVNSPMVSAPLNQTESGGQIKIPGVEGGNQFGGGGGGGIGGGGGGGIGGGGQGGIGGGGQGGAGGGGSLVGGQGLVPSGIDFVSFDPTDNSFVVRGPEEDIDELQKYIATFDVAPKQVQVKVEYITTTSQFEHDLGYEFLYQRGTVLAGEAPGNFADYTAPIFLNYATGNVVTNLRTRLLMGDGKVVESPIVKTLNNQPVILTSSTQEYISYPSTIVSNGLAVTTQQLLPISAFTQLAVTPRINNDGTITMYLQPQISNFVGTSVTGAGTFPNLVQESLSVVARVRNGETVVLGGLTNQSDTHTQQRVPVLGDLPIVGQFFRSDAKGRTNSELLIFVTPTVLDEDGLPTEGGP